MPLRIAAGWFPLSTRPSLAFWRDVELQSPFDRRSLPVYSVMLAMAGAGFCLCLALRFKISPTIFP